MWEMLKMGIRAGNGRRWMLWDLWKLSSSVGYVFWTSFFAGACGCKSGDHWGRLLEKIFKGDDDQEAIKEGRIQFWWFSKRWSWNQVLSKLIVSFYSTLFIFEKSKNDFLPNYRCQLFSLFLITCFPISSTLFSILKLTWLLSTYAKTYKFDKWFFC